MTDDEFLGYVLLHSKTDLALFSADHVKRLCKLAGETAPDLYPKQFVGVHYDVAKPLVDKAREKAKV